MEIKLFTESPLEKFSLQEKRRSETPGRALGPGLNPRQMFSSALRRTDISPQQPSGYFRANETVVKSTEVSLFESGSHHKSQTSEPTPYASMRLSDSSLHFRDVTNAPAYKEMYERAVALHAQDKQRWERERQELLERIQRLELAPAARNSPSQYLQRINQEIEVLKTRLRSTELQNTTIRERSHAKAR